MPVDVDSGARYNVSNGFIREVLPINERPPNGIDELLRP